MLQARTRRRIGAGVLAATSCALMAAAAFAGFRPARSYDVGMGPYDVVAGKFVGGHGVDLAVSSRTDGMVSLLKGKGNGKFDDADPIPAGPMPLGMATGDFNRDHRTDMAVANQDTPGGVTVLLATKTGFQLPAPTYPAGDQTSYVVAADFNRDGKLDLAASNLASASVSVFLGNGHGGFGAATTVPGLSGAFGLTVSDFNQDGKKDLAVIVDTPYRIAVLLGKGNGRFRAPTFYPAGLGLNSVIAAKLNGDSRPDLVAMDYPAGKVIVLLGKRGGKFGDPHGFPVGHDNAATASVLNYNHDGKTDIAVADAISTPGFVSILRGKGNGRFKAPISKRVGDEPYAVTSGRFNSDRYDDLATANSADHTASVLIRFGKG